MDGRTEEKKHHIISRQFTPFTWQIYKNGAASDSNGTTVLCHVAGARSAEQDE